MKRPPQQGHYTRKMITEAIRAKESGAKATQEALLRPLIVPNSPNWVALAPLPLALMASVIRTIGNY